MALRSSSTARLRASRVRLPSVSMARRRPLSVLLSEPGPWISRIVTFVPTLLVRGRPIPRLSMGNRQTPLHGSCPPSRWDAWENPMKLLEPHFFWHRTIPVLSQVSNCSLMVAEDKSDRLGAPTTLGRAYSERGINDNNKSISAGFGGHGNRCPGREQLFHRGGHPPQYLFPAGSVPTQASLILAMYAASTIPLALFALG